MLKKLFSHTAIYGLAPQIPKIAGIVALPIITPFLTDVDFGVYGVITALAGAISVLSILGLRLVLVNTYYKSPGQYKWAWRQIYGFLILWNFPYALLLAGIFYFFIPPEAYDDRIYIIILNVLPLVFFGPTSNLGVTYYQLEQRPMEIALRTGIIGIVTVTLNVFFIAYLKMGYMGWFISTCIGTMISNISYWIPLNFKLKIKPIFNYKRRFIFNSLKVSLPTIPHYYSSYLLNSSDKIIMKFLNIPTNQIGLYNAAYIVGNVFSTIGFAAGLAISPLMNSAYKRSNDLEARNLVFVLQVVFFFITFLSSVWLKEIFQILIKNDTLNKMYPLGIIIVMSYNYRPMYMGANNKLFYVEKTKTLLKVTFVAGISNVLLNLIFIPLYGYESAAYITFISLMYMGYAGFYLKEFKQINNVEYFPVRWLTVTILLTILSSFLVEFDLIVKALISILTTIIFVLCIILLNKKLNDASTNN